MEWLISPVSDAEPSQSTLAMLAPAPQRAAHLRTAYSHFAVAILVMMGLMMLLLYTDLGIRLMHDLVSTPAGWLLVFGILFALSWINHSWMHSDAPVSVQYLALLGVCHVTGPAGLADSVGAQSVS